MGDCHPYRLGLFSGRIRMYEDEDEIEEKH